MLDMRKSISRRSSASCSWALTTLRATAAQPFLAAMCLSPSSEEATLPNRKHAASMTRVFGMLLLITAMTASTPPSRRNCTVLACSCSRFPNVSHATPWSVGLDSCRWSDRKTRETQLHSDMFF